MGNRPWVTDHGGVHIPFTQTPPCLPTVTGRCTFQSISKAAPPQTSTLYLHALHHGNTTCPTTICQTSSTCASTVSSIHARAHHTSHRHPRPFVYTTLHVFIHKIRAHTRSASSSTRVEHTRSPSSCTRVDCPPHPEPTPNGRRSQAWRSVFLRLYPPFSRIALYFKGWSAAARSRLHAIAESTAGAHAVEGERRQIILPSYMHGCTPEVHTRE
jgi:hypothetical protein